MVAFDIIYTKQEGFFKNNGEFVVKRNYTEKYTVFAKDEKEAREKFSKETNFGSKRIKEVRRSESSFLGDNPILAALKNKMKE